jgi:hypothetical protein
MYCVLRLIGTQGPAITDEASPLALRSTRNDPGEQCAEVPAGRRRTTCRCCRGGARPVGGSVGPSASLLLSGPDCCPPRRRLPEAASSRSRELGRRRRGRPCQQASHGAGRRCPAGGVHPSGYWRPGIRLSSRPVSGHLGWSSSGSGARPSAVHPSAVQPSAVHLSAVHLSGVQPSGVCPVGPDASVSSHAQALALGTRSSWPGDPDHQNRWRPRWLPSRRRLERRSRRPGRGRRCPRRVGQGRSVAVPGRRGWVRAAAAALAR